MAFLLISLYDLESFDVIWLVYIWVDLIMALSNSQNYGSFLLILFLKMEENWSIVWVYLFQVNVDASPW